MRREKRTAATTWLETWNPLRGMSIRDAQNLFDASRQGDTQRLHWMFQEIEATNPVLLVCVERRSSAIANFRWKVSELAAYGGGQGLTALPRGDVGGEGAAETRGAQGEDALTTGEWPIGGEGAAETVESRASRNLSEEQKDAAERLLNGIDNLTDTFEHLDLAFFRGFAHAQPIWEADGTVREVSLLDSWKFVKSGGAWFYNPKCTGLVEGDMQETANARLMTIVRRRPIDYPALGIHIRHAVGSRDWGRFLERYALPKPAVFMHPNATNEQRDDYLEGAQAVENGQVSVWPNGASLTDFAGSARGTDPFGAFIEHQEKQIVLLATGGTLMSLAEAGTGTLAGNAQSDVWRSIVARDSAVVAQAVQKGLVEPYLAAKFPGAPCAVKFGFDFDEPPTPKEVFEIAALAKQAGWTIDQQQLEEATGYTLVRDEGAGCSVLGAGSLEGAGTFANKVGGEGAPRLAAPSGGFAGGYSETLEMAAGRDRPPYRVGGEGAAETRGAQGDEARSTKHEARGTKHKAQSTLLAAFARDNAPLAKAVETLLQDPSKDAVEALLKDLPSLMPDDPATAAIIAEEMAKEFGESGGEGDDNETKGRRNAETPLQNSPRVSGRQGDAKVAEGV